MANLLDELDKRYEQKYNNGGLLSKLDAAAAEAGINDEPPQPSDEGIVSNFIKGTKAGVAGVYGGLAGWAGGENAATKYFDDVVQSNQRSQTYDGYNVPYFTNGSGLSYDIGQLFGSVVSTAPAAFLPGLGAAGAAAARFIPRLLGSGFARSAASSVGAGAARAAVNRWASDEATKNLIKNAVRYGAGSGGVESLSEGGSGVTEGFKTGNESPYLTGLEITAKNLPLLIASNTLEGATLGRGLMRFGGKAGESLAKRAALSVPRATPYAMAQAVQQSGEELAQQHIQEEAFNRPTGGVLPSTWTPEEAQVVQDTFAAGAALGLLGGLPGGMRARAPQQRSANDPTYNASLAQARALLHGQNLQNNTNIVNANGNVGNSAILSTAQKLLNQQKQEEMQKLYSQLLQNDYNQQEQFNQPEQTSNGKVDISMIPMQDIEDEGLAHTNNALKSKLGQLYAWAKDNLGQGFVISGGWRSPEHNKRVNGSSTSHHLHGNAVDVDVSMYSEADKERLLAKAREMGFNNFGNGDNMYHDRGSGLHAHLTYEDDGTGGDQQQSSNGGFSNDRFIRIAQKTAALIRQKYPDASPNLEKYLYGQMAHETGHFTHDKALEYNNFAGLHGGAEGRHYANDDEYIKDYASFFTDGYHTNAIYADSGMDFARRLSNKLDGGSGWYTDRNYQAYGNTIEEAVKEFDEKAAAAGYSSDNVGSNSSANINVEIPQSKQEDDTNQPLQDAIDENMKLANAQNDVSFGQQEEKTDKELITEAKQAAQDAGDMDELQRIIKAERSGNQSELAKITEKAREAKAKEAKGKSAPPAPKINTVNKNLAGIVQKLVHQAKNEGIQISDELVNNVIASGDEAQLKNYVGMLQNLIKFNGYEARVAKGKDLLNYADENRIDIPPAVRQYAFKGYQKGIDQVQAIIDRANNGQQEISAPQPIVNAEQRPTEQTATPMQTELPVNMKQEAPQVPPQVAPQVAQSENAPQPVQVESAQNQPVQLQNGVTAGQMTNAYNAAMVPMAESQEQRSKQGKALITVANGAGVELPDNMKPALREGSKVAIPKAQEIINNAGVNVPEAVQATGSNKVKAGLNAIVDEHNAQMESAPKQKRANVDNSGDKSANDERKDLIDRVMQGYHDGKKSLDDAKVELKHYRDRFANMARGKVTPTEGRSLNEIVKYADQQLKELESASKEKSNNELSQQENNGKIEVEEKPAKKGPTIVRTRTRLHFDNDGIHTEVISQEEVEPMGEPKAEKQEVDENEQQGESGSPDGGHSGVRSGKSGKDQREGSGEVSGRNGRKGESAGRDNDEEHSEGSQSAGVRAGTELEDAAGEGTDKRGNQPTVPLTEAEEHPSPTEIPGNDYEIKDTDQSTKSEKVRFKQNVDAIKMLKQLEEDDRMPTPAEQEILGAYNGWGGLKNAFLDGNEMNKELRDLLTDAEYKAAQSTINDAFYTPPKIIRAIWEGVSHLGFKGGRVLDPSMGVGNFFGTMPRDMMEKSALRGVELDNLTSRFAKMLYPSAFVENKGFQKASVADNYFDLAISNIPFGQNMINGYQVHNYFFANGIDKVRPGGLMVYITSQGSLAGGKDAAKMRNYLENQADLIAAYKLPSGVFSDAGTQVATDIVIFRKRDKDGKKSPYGQKFGDVKEVKVGQGYYAPSYGINEYFVTHKENILGEQSIGRDQWGNTALNVKMAEGASVADVANDLSKAMQKLPTDVYQPVSRKKSKSFDTASAQKKAAADEKTRDYEYYYKDGKPVQNQNGQEVALTGKKAKVVDDYLKVKNTLNALFAAESDPKAKAKDVEGLRKKLNKDYDSFVAKHGLLTGTAAKNYADDPSAGMVQALEKPVKGGKKGEVEKADIFTTRSIKAVQEVSHVETADDALIASLTNHGTVDLDYMAELMNSKPETIVSKLKGKLFKNPTTGEYETRDEYLSGNVREKLAQAKEAAKSDKSYEGNVKELEKVIPEDLVSDEIFVNLGTPWIPVQDVQAFVDTIADSVHVSFSRGAALWTVTGWGRSAKYKLKGIDFPALLNHVLNNKAIQIYDGSGDDKVFNQEKTDAANVAAEELQQDFKDWIWKDKDREKRLVKYYNDNYNNTVVRQYDGQHLNLHAYGMNAKINLKPHQKDVVWRMLQGGNTLIAHCVGAGKTFEMQAAGMEMRRLGIANKPMYCLPNNVVQQFAREFRQLYPNAKLLVLQSNDLPAVEKTSRVEKTEDGRTKRVSLLEGKSEEQKAAIMAKRTARNRMLNRIRTEDWDGIIISHNLFQRFPVNPETAAEFIQQEIDTLEQTIREAKQDKMDSRALSNLETSKKNLQERLEEVISTDIEDIGVPFEELGIDQLFVDEADMFKNLAFATRLGNIRGLSNSKANRSQDMFLKTQWLTNNMGGRGVVFATGTPVSNTMSELYTMMRYLDMKGLKEKGLEVFDNWMRTFGDIGQGIERKPTGDGFRKVTMIKRFINMAELTKMFRSFADVKVQDELNLDIPKLKNDKSTVVALEPDEKVVNYIKNVVPERVKKMKSGFKKEKGEDNMLSLTNDLRKLSLTDSKIEACADAIAKKYHDTADVKGTQLVFCDMGIPKAESDKASGEGTATTFDVESPEVYRTLIAKLKEKGIPDKDIAFIQNYNTKTKRDEVFQKVNNGEIRILIGSTETMGAGTNCQTHLVALHDLDAPWRPRDLEQRHGRILRQGNENKEVEIFNYVVKDSFDANMWEKLKNKAAIIQQAMSGDMNMRTVEDADLVTLSYAEVEGAATGNPLIKEQLQVQNDLTKYQHAQTAFRKKIRDAENTLAGSEESIAEQERVIAKIEKDIAQRKDTKGEKFSMLINGKGYKDRDKANEALANILKNYKQQKSMEIGQIGGFRLTALYSPDGGLRLQLVNNRAYEVKTHSVAGIENTLRNGPEKSLELRQKDLDTYKKNVAQAQEIVQQENPYAEKVKQLSDRLNQLNREIADTLVDDGKQKVAQAEDTSIDSEPETEVKEPVKEEKTEAPKEEAKKDFISDHIIVGTVPPAGKSTANVNVDEFKHTKTGKMIPAASLKDHVAKDFRKQATAIAKNHGGKWSPFAKRILFKTEQGRDDFVREVEALLSVTNPESSGAIEVKFSQEGWHGSKYHFDKFDVTKIGTGEGAQAHGHGLYIAGNRKVSEGYRKRLAGYVEMPSFDDVRVDGISLQDMLENATDNGEYEKQAMLENYERYDRQGVLQSAKEEGFEQEYIDWFNKLADKVEKQLPKQPGKLYEVEIPDNDVLLDEQKPFNEQPEKVQNALKELAQIEDVEDDDFYFEFGNKNLAKAIERNLTGREIYEALTEDQVTAKLASEELNKAGIKGITYEGGLDGRCFVIFDDQAIKIINKFSAEGEIRRAVERAVPVANEDLTPQQRKMSEFGKEMGTPILWISTDPKLHGFHAPNGTTVLNVRSNMDLSKTFWHEAFHWVAGNNEALYNELLDYFKGKSAFSKKQLDAYRKRIGRPGISDELAMEEMLADYFEEVKDRVKIFKEMGAEQPSLARKFVAWVKRIMDKFAEFFHNPEGKLTTAQRDSFVKAFGRLARDMKDGQGRPLFKVYKEGKEIRLPSGQLVTEGLKLSAENDIDNGQDLSDNKSRRKTSSREHMAFENNDVDNKITLSDDGREITSVELGLEVNDDETETERVERRKKEIRAFDKQIARMEGNKAFIKLVPDSNQAYIDRLLAEGKEGQALIEQYQAQFHEELSKYSETMTEERHIERALILKGAAYYVAEKSNISYDEERSGGIFDGGYEQSRGRDREEKPAGEKEAEQVTTKHSDSQGAFSYGETKYSYGPSNNSNEGIIGKMKNIFSGKANLRHENWRYRKRLTEMLADALDIKIVTGGIAPDNPNTVVYRPTDRMIRSRDAYDFLNILPLAAQVTAQKLGIVDDWRKTPDAMRNYIVDWISTGAPNNTSPEAKQFAEKMRGNKILAAKLQLLQENFDEWNAMPYDEQMQRTIQHEKHTKVDLKSIKEQLHDEWVEELGPIQRLVESVNARLTAKGQKELSIVSDPYLNFRLLRGSYGRTMTMIEGENEGAIDALREAFPTVKWDGFKTIYQILKDIDAFQNRDRQRDFITYCAAYHILDMHKHNDEIKQKRQNLEKQIQSIDQAIEEGTKRQKELLGRDMALFQHEVKELRLVEEGIKSNTRKRKELMDKKDNLKEFRTPTTFSRENCERYIKDYDQKYGPKFHQAQQDLVRFSNTTAEILYDSGVITKKRFDELMESWPNYVPTFRVFDENDDIDFGDSLKHVEGSPRDLVNPLESIIRNTAQFIDRAETNKARLLLANIARCDESGWLLSETEATGKEKHLIKFYENGVAKYLETDPAIAKAVNNFMRPGTSAMWVKLMHAITRIARMAFTMASPEFMIRNPPRDWADASLYYKYGYVISPMDIIRGFIHAIKRDKVYYEWQTQGAAQASILTLDRDYTQSTLDKMGRSTIRRLASKDILSAMVDGLQKLSEFSEEATRIAMYEKTKQAVMEQKNDATLAMMEAAFESRDYMDFARSGASGREYNKLVAFSNASIQGLSKLWRQLSNPETRTKTIAKLAIFSILPTIALFMLYKDDEWYRKAPRWLKETHWLFKIGDETFRIPKGQDFGIRFISNTLELMMLNDYTNRPHKFKEYWKPVEDTLPDIMWTAAAPLIEVTSNHNYFTNRPIVPMVEEKLPNKLQYGENQTLLAKKLGEMLDVSPRNIEHFIAGYTGTLGMFPLKLIDFVSGEKSQSLSIEEYPLIRGYLWKDFKQPLVVDDFYNALNEQTKLKNEYKMTHKRPADFNPALLQRLENAQKQMKKIKKQEKAIIDSDKWSIHDKEVMQRNIQKKRIEIAKRALGTK